MSSRPFVRMPVQWSAWDKILFRTGVGCVLFGIAALVLPQFGLQVRKLNQLGPSGASAAGWGLISVGAFLSAYVAVFKGRMLRIVLWGAGLAVLAFAALLGVGAYESNRRSAPPAFQPPPGGQAAPPTRGAAPSAGEPPRSAARPPQAGPPVGPGNRSAPPVGPENRPAPSLGPGNRPGPPAGPQTPPPLADAYKQLCSEFGEEHVARVTFTNAEAPELSAHVRALKDDLLPVKRKSWRLGSLEKVPTLLIAPVEDLDALARNLDLGEAEIDAKERKLRIAVDRTRLKK